VIADTADPSITTEHPREFSAGHAAEGMSQRRQADVRTRLFQEAQDLGADFRGAVGRRPPAAVGLQPVGWASIVRERINTFLTCAREGLGA